MYTYRASLACAAALTLACADVRDPVSVEPSRKPTFHVPIAGESVVKSTFGTATIDGVLSPGEWNSTLAISFTANLPAADGGGTTPATLYVSNDASNLYLALKIARTSLGGTTNSVFEFDNEHLGGLAPQEGDDVFGMSIGIFSPATFLDSFRTYQPPCPVGACGLADIAFGGTNDGSAAGSNDGLYTYVELAHPLNGSDPAHDFRLKPGDITGFNLVLNLWSLSPFCLGNGCNANTGLPTENSYNRALFADLQLADAVLSVNIDVKPGSSVNAINRKSKGVTPVAILSASAFDATAVNPASVLVAGAPAIELPNGTLMVGREDVNGDGRTDLVIHIDTSAFKLSEGLVQVVLTGETFDGREIRGSDWARVVQ